MLIAGGRKYGLECVWGLPASFSFDKDESLRGAGLPLAASGGGSAKNWRQQWDMRMGPGHSLQQAGSGGHASGLPYALSLSSTSTQDTFPHHSDAVQQQVRTLGPVLLSPCCCLLSL